MGKTFNMRGGQSGGAPGAYARIIINANANANIYVEHNGVVKSVLYNGENFIYKAREYGDYHVYGTLEEYSNDGEVVEVIEATDYTVALRFGVPPHTVAYWPFEEDTVDIIGGLDFSQSIGTWCINPSIGPYESGALTLEGNNSRLTLAPDIDGLCLDLAPDKTYEFWAHFSAAPNLHLFRGITTRQVTQRLYYYYGWELHIGQIPSTHFVGIELASPDNSSASYYNLSYAITEEDIWHHFSVNISTDEIASLYIDGILSSEQEITTQYSVDSTRQSEIRNSSSVSIDFYGLLVTDKMLRTENFTPPTKPYVVL